MSFIVFDIETGPLPDEKLRTIFDEFDRSSVQHPGEFDPASVKVGNLGEAKAAEKINAAKIAHEEAVANYGRNVAAAESNYWQEIRSRAALSAITGRVLLIGYKSDKQEGLHHITDTRSEEHLLSAFWAQYEKCRKSDRQMVGFNSKDFDIPFIAQSSIILGVPVPKTLLQNDRYLDKTFVDLRDKFGFGQWQPKGSLDFICRGCGIPGKPEGVTGAMFAELFGNAETQPQALEYALNDIRMTYALAEKLL